MRAVLSGLLAAGTLLMAATPAASADAQAPESALAFRDSVGVNTHVVYYDTPYADWPRVVAKLEELGVRHLRDGVFGNPSRRWRDWNERYYRAVELAVARGMRFNFIMGRPGNDAGTLDQLIDVVAGRLRPAAEALEAPNEFDHFVGGRRWPTLLRAYARDLYGQANAHPALRSLPVVGPSFGTVSGADRVGDQRSWIDVGNIHPYTGGLSPRPEHVRSGLGDLRSGPRPVWATEAGFHNALRATTDHPPVSENAAAVYLLRTFLEHFRSGIARTYAYELIDEKPDPSRRDPERNFGLLRHDFTPKPAFTALKNLMGAVGEGDEQPRLRPLRLSVRDDRQDVRRLVLQKGDGTYLVALWRLAEVWDPERRRPLAVAPRSVVVDLPQAERVAVADPVVSAGARPLRLRGARVRVELAGRPLLLHVVPKRPG